MKDVTKAVYIQAKINVIIHKIVLVKICKVLFRVYVVVVTVFVVV